jgi:hypothetical protein
LYGEAENGYFVWISRVLCFSLYIRILRLSVLSDWKPNVCVDCKKLFFFPPYCFFMVCFMNLFHFDFQDVDTVCFAQRTGSGNLSPLSVGLLRFVDIRSQHRRFLGLDFV